MRNMIFLCLLLPFILTACSQEEEEVILTEQKKMLILNIDDIGMCPEANQAAQQYMEQGAVFSGSVMMTCQYAEEFVEWAKNKPHVDVGVHLTLNSEWKNWRWGPLSGADEVAGLIDAGGYLWTDVVQVALNAKPHEVEKEIRRQIDAMIALGITPSHIDTHMGALYSTHELLEVFIKVAEEYRIPANIIDFANPKVAEVFRNEGYPVDTKAAQLLSGYSLPRLRYFTGIPGAVSYDDKKSKLFNIIDKLEPGITMIIFHPSVESGFLKSFMNSWQQRVWESRLFFDPEVMSYLKENDVVLTSWKEVMKQHK